MGVGKRSVEGLVTIGPAGWRGRSVLVTGHTGFKGGWLSLWLHQLGATVHGYALEPPTKPSLFEVARIGSIMASDTWADLADLTRLRGTLKSAGPEVVFHMAAQPLVRESYRDPLATLGTNVIGTSHVLEAARACESVRAVVVITSDKVYADVGSGQPHREGDALGGHDPYSASKAAAEIVTASYRDSFFSRRNDSPTRIATARAGNVIGGGDWAAERLMPDCLRAFQNHSPVRLRYPNALRPWQHVLEPLSGYMRLAEALIGSKDDDLANAWNFGPGASSDATVRELAELTAKIWGNGACVDDTGGMDSPHERGLLRLDSTRARDELGWRPRWSLRDALQKTVAWHRAWMSGADMVAVTSEQIEAYEAAGSR